MPSEGLRIGVSLRLPDYTDHTSNLQNEHIIKYNNDYLMC